MTEQELRQLVRDAIARQSAQSQPAVSATATAPHASHAMFVVPAGDEIGGPCIIEPSVMCNHCGYCKSYGH